MFLCHKKAFLLAFILLILACNNQKLEKEQCPYERIVSFKDTTIKSNGIKNSAKVGLTVKGNLKRIGDLGFEFQDSMKFSLNSVEQVVTEEMDYSSEQVLKHNRLIKMICGRYNELQAISNEQEKRHLRKKLDEVIDKYFDFLLANLDDKEVKKDTVIINIVDNSGAKIKEEEQIKEKQYRVTAKLIIDYQYTNSKIKVNGKYIAPFIKNDTLIISGLAKNNKFKVQILPRHQRECNPIDYNIFSDTLIIENFQCL